jgi:hypothetical protein
MHSTTHDAADFIRARLREMDSRISQDQMATLIDDLKAAMGRVLTARDVAEVVDVFRELTTRH